MASAASKEIVKRIQMIGIAGQAQYALTDMYEQMLREQEEYWQRLKDEANKDYPVPAGEDNELGS